MNDLSMVAFFCFFVEPQDFVDDFHVRKQHTSATIPLQTQAVQHVAGAAGGYTVGHVAARYFENVQLPGAVPILGAAAVLVGAAVLAALMPAARASRVDVLQALRSE